MKVLISLMSDDDSWDSFPDATDGDAAMEQPGTGIQISCQRAQEGRHSVLMPISHP